MGEIVLGLLTLLACAAPPPPGPASPKVAGQELAALDGVKLKALLDEPSGHVRVVNFWAMWCRPCVAELPELSAFAARHPEIELVLVNLDATRARSKVPGFLISRKIDVGRLTYFDSDDAVSEIRTVVPGWPDSIPVTWAIGPDGHPLARWARPVDASDLEPLVPGAAAP